MRHFGSYNFLVCKVDHLCPYALVPTDSNYASFLSSVIVRHGI